MFPKLKPRKCRKCKVTFNPKLEWNWYCGAKCRTAASNARRADILKWAQRIIERNKAVGQ